MINTQFLESFNGNPGLDVKDYNTEGLPDDYIEFLKVCNGGEGYIGDEHLVLHRFENLKEINANYEIEKFDSNITLIGHNGGSEAIAINSTEGKFKYVLIPFIFETDSIIELGSDINEFLNRLTKRGYF